MKTSETPTRQAPGHQGRDDFPRPAMAVSEHTALPFNSDGFTLVEILIVAAIIGLLAAIGIPYMIRAGEQSRAARFSRDIKTAGHAFVQYAFDHGEYPADKTPGQMPDGMAPYLAKFPWMEETVIGGRWDWDYGVFGVMAGVSVHTPDFNADRMRKIDNLIDDGNLGSGQFRARSGGYIYILEY